jgi:hypothetical protein
VVPFHIDIVAHHTGYAVWLCLNAVYYRSS